MCDDWEDNEEVEDGPENDFTGKMLADQSFMGRDLRSACFHMTTIARANFIGADLNCAQLTQVHGSAASFRAADLSWAELSYSRFHHADFRLADLRGADWHEGDFRNADFTGAKIDQNIREAKRLDYASFSATALPWLILHPKWAEFKDTVQITGG